ncbi:MMPL family transporter [Streptomyces sp. NPDC048275]|uniref:MMPL family transporter n=1 Tax=Streptomyces sp. NPDC048275 TaxID=3155629 RepID=UPI003401E282
MSTFLYRLGRFSYRHKWGVIVGWLLMLCALGATAMGLMKPFATSTTIPGTEAQRALDVLEKEFPSSSDGVTGEIVFQTAEGTTVTAGAEGKAVREATDTIADIPGAEAVAAPSAQLGTVSPDGRTGMAKVMFDAEQPGEIDTTTLEKAADSADSSAMTVAHGGDAFDPWRRPSAASAKSSASSR